ncbi:CD209 antigen-like protein A [Embiotoca jacksoni]|uniref:CD209 antigen-like protein A n=1 Tax=Embiotoca jacksoni TaxID=100190 RepID=UPI003703826D
MEYYVNSAADEARDHPEKTENCCPGRSKVYSLVGVSVGLLCMLQSALNVSLRLKGIGSCNNHINSTTVTLIPFTDTHRLERDRLVNRIRELEASTSHLIEDNNILNDLLRQQINQEVQLQAEIKRLSQVGQTPLSCSPGWRLYMSSCYQLSTEETSWNNANEDCVSKGAHLVILNDEVEKDVLRIFGHTDVWIGLRAQFKLFALMWTWTWVDGTTMPEWMPSVLQPGSCAIASIFDTLSYNGAKCSEQHYWVCEKELK